MTAATSPPPPPPPPVTPEAPAKKSRKKQILLGAGGVILLIIIISAIAGGGKSKSDSSASPTTTAATATTNAGDTATTAAPVAAKTCKDTPNTESFDSKKQGLYPGRAGVQKTDHEAAVGDCVRISGATLYVNGAEVVTDSITNKQGILVTVSETNRDKNPKMYNPFEWKLQTPQGTLETMTVIFGDSSKSFGSGELVTGGTATGTIAFEYAGPGTYYVVYDPALSTDAGIWGITIP